MRSVLIVEDIAEARDWLSTVVQAAFPAAAITTADSVRAALALLDPDGSGPPCDLALIDLGLADGSGLTVLRQLRTVRPAAIRVVTTVMGDDASIVAALAAGADGYVLKETPDPLLIRQLANLSLGLPALSPPVARRIMAHFRRTGPATDADERLTDREAQVLGLIGRGLRNTEVAATLQIAESTVAGYIKSVYAKLGIGSRAEAAWHALRLGLTSD